MKKLLTFILFTLFSLNSFADDEMNVFFNSPSKNIFCGGHNHFVSCMILETNAKPAQPRPEDCNLDWGQMVYLPIDGKPELVCHGDFPFEQNARTLNYDERFGKLKWLCTSSEKGMQCENHLGHGFIISRMLQELY